MQTSKTTALHPEANPCQHPATNIYPDQSEEDFASEIDGRARMYGLCGKPLAVKQDFSEGSMIESNSNTEMQRKAVRARMGDAPSGL